MRKQKYRKGTSLIETVIAVTLLSLAVIVMTKITSVKVSESANIDSQYVYISADALLSDIYHDFQRSDSAIAISAEDSADCSLYFNFGSEGMIEYEYVQSAGYLYKDGIETLQCKGFEARIVANNMYLSIKISNDRTLEMDVYK